MRTWWLWGAAALVACGNDFTDLGFGGAAVGGAPAASSSSSGGGDDVGVTVASSSSSGGGASSATSSSSSAASSSSGGMTDAEICAAQHPNMKTCVPPNYKGDGNGMCSNSPNSYECGNACVNQCGSPNIGHSSCLSLKPDQGPCCCTF